MKFSFKRRVGYYFIQVYLPAIFVVALSWIVFWMGKDAMGDRMTLGITTILAVMFLLGSLNGNLPKVSYPKALDWYLLMSFTFVFLSLVECMTVFVLNLSAAEHKEHIKCKVRYTIYLSALNNGVFSVAFCYLPRYGKRWRLYILQQYLAKLTVRAICTHRKPYFGKLHSCTNKIVHARFEVFRPFLCVFMSGFRIFVR